MNTEGRDSKRLWIWAGAAVLALLLLVVIQVRGKTEITPEFVFSYAENQTEDYPTAQGGRKFAQLVEERTQGRIRILVQAGGVWGSEGEVIRQMQYGGIDFARISLAQISDELPQMNVLQLPFIYRDSAHMWRVLDGETGERFLEYPSECGLIGLSWYDAGARNFYCVSRPIRTLEDMKGLRIRVQEAELMSEMMFALDAVPVQVPYDQVYSLLEQGQVDGAENNWPSYETMQHYEVAGYYTVDEHIRIPEMQICAKHTWDQLSAADQQIIRECARESALYERELWSEREHAARRTALNNQAEEIILPEEERKKFQAAMQPIYEKYCQDYGEDIKAILAHAEER